MEDNHNNFLKPLLVIMVVGMQFVWSFSMTMNQVVPWINVTRNAHDYVPAKFEIEKAYFSKSTLPRNPDTWEVVGKVDQAEPARIVYGSLYRPSKDFHTEDDFKKEFPIGKQFDVLINYKLHYKNSIRLINARTNLVKESSAILARSLLYSNGNLLVTFAVIGCWFYFRRKRGARKSQMDASPNSKEPA